MIEPDFTFRFVQSPALSLAAAKTRIRSGAAPVKGARWLFPIKLLQCCMLGFGALGVGIILEYLASGMIRLSIWSVAIGIVFLYIAVFGSIFVTLPTLIRSALAARANQGEVAMTLNAAGLHTRMDHFESQIAWAGIETVARSKLGLVFLVGLNRPSLPFSAIGDAAAVDRVDAAITKWIEASR